MSEKKKMLWSSLQKVTMVANGMIIMNILVVEFLKIGLPNYVLISMIISIILTLLADIMLKEYKYLYSDFIMILALCTNVIMYMLNF